MIIRPVQSADFNSIWAIISPIVSVGETYPIDRNICKTKALAWWTGSNREVFVAELGGKVLGTYYILPNKSGGGKHVCNCGYMVAAEATGRGVARRMCEHSLDHATALGFKAMQFNFVVSTNERAIGLWKSLDFDVVGRVPKAFLHPSRGYVDALVMHRCLAQ